MTYGCGQRYEGQWLLGLRHGFGRLTMRSPGWLPEPEPEPEPEAEPESPDEDDEEEEGSAEAEPEPEPEPEEEPEPELGPAPLLVIGPGWWEGEWANDQRHGVGRLYRADGTLELEGRWENNRLAGQSPQHPVIAGAPFRLLFSVPARYRSAAISGGLTAWSSVLHCVCLCVNAL